MKQTKRMKQTGRRRCSGLIVSALAALVLFLCSTKPVWAGGSIKNQPETISLGKTYTCNFSGCNINDYYEYRITLPSSGRLAFVTTVSGSSSIEGRYLGIYDHTGKEIEKVYHRKGSYSDAFDLLKGEYTVRFINGTTKQGQDTFIASFAASKETVSESYASLNNDVGSAVAYTPGTSVTGQLAVNDEVDMYKFSVSEKGRVTLSLVSNLPDTRFEIMNAGGTFKKQEKGIKPGSHTYTYQDVPKGTYYLSFYRTGKTDTGTYTFSVSCPGSASQAKKVSLQKPVNRAGGKLLIKWKAVSGVKGYQIQLAKNKGFTKGLKKYTVKSARTSSKTVKKLKKGTTYYVRIRSYAAVSGKKTYSPWSAVKKVKIKK